MPVAKLEISKLWLLVAANTTSLPAIKIPKLPGVKSFITHWLIPGVEDLLVVIFKFNIVVASTVFKYKIFLTSE